MGQLGAAFPPILTLIWSFFSHEMRLLGFGLPLLGSRLQLSGSIVPIPCLVSPRLAPPGIGRPAKQQIFYFALSPKETDEELEQVKGIGKKRLEEIRPLVTAE